MENNNDLVENFFKKSKIKKLEPERTETESSSGPPPTPTPPTTSGTYMESLERMRARYAWSDMDSKRGKRRMSWEFFDDHGEVIGSVARQLSAELNENLSASHLIRKWVEEGIRKAEKDLESLRKLK